MRALLAATLLLAGCASMTSWETGVESQAPKASAAVRIELATGLGSGVYIGNGVIVTAAHVVGDVATVTLRSDAGDVQRGEVLWTNKQYDIAAIKPANARRFNAATLACRDALVGEPLVSEGNPFGLQFISMRGYVASKTSEYAPQWKAAFVTDISMASGMSGGPAFDAYGEVIGINVGVVDPHGSASGATSGFAFVVPSSVVCGLLGRA